MKDKRGKRMIYLGLLLIAAALLLIGYNLYDNYRAGKSVQRVMEQMEELMQPEENTHSAGDGLSETDGDSADLDNGDSDNASVNNAAQGDTDKNHLAELEIPDYVLNPEMEMPVKTIDGQDYIGTLEIPVLDMTFPIISQWSYPSLRIAPCRYAGSAYTDNLIIAGHNYDSHFGPLKNLEIGDHITFTDMDRNVFTYVVVEKETLKPTDVEEMTSGDWDLTLFTCTVDRLSRMAIRCCLIEK